MRSAYWIFPILFPVVLHWVSFCLTFIIITMSSLYEEVTKRVYFTGNERMLIAHDSNRLRFS